MEALLGVLLTSGKLVSFRGPQKFPREMLLGIDDIFKKGTELEWWSLLDSRECAFKESSRILSLLLFFLPSYGLRSFALPSSHAPMCCPRPKATGLTDNGLRSPK